MPMSRPLDVDAQGLGLALCTSRSARANALAGVAATLMTVGIAASFLALGNPPVSIHGFDIFVLLDAGARISQGQLPHVDYFSPLGPVYQFIVYWAMMLDPSATALVYAHIGLLVLVSCWAWVIAQARLPALWAGLIVPCLGLLTMMPRPLSFAAEDWGYSMAYNRVGWALSALLCLSAALPKGAADESVKLRLATTLSDAALLTILLLLKLSYFLVMAPLVLLLLWRRGVAWNWNILRSLLVLPLASGCLWWMGISPFDFAMDMWRVLTSGAGGLITKGLARLTPNAEEVGLVLLMSALLMAKARLSLRAWLAHPPTQLMLAILAAGLIISTGNAQLFEIPLLTISAVVFVEWTLRGPQGTKPAAGILLFAILVVTGMLARLALRDVSSLIAASRWQERSREIPVARAGQYHSSREFIRMSAQPVAGLQFPTTRQASPAAYAAVIEDGFRLLREHATANSRILDMSGTPNPFPYLLDLPSPKGAALFWELGPTQHTIDFLDTESIFQDVTMVLWERENYEGKEPIPGSFEHRHGAYVRQHFEARARSSSWVLLQRRSIPTHAALNQLDSTRAKRSNERDTAYQSPKQ